ncbi:MAG TPA: Stk1 family PASTA domain-containing Ser/Thr kinase [Candidatus Acidoferrales bacterium]|nr:Stk1 family PASTA domain-containing Ser/Thr kinase [Candidatus Acidoferrales bacterium]
MTEHVFNDRYRLDSKIGEGGMATVFSGIDTLLRRRVAIKVLRPQYAADEDFVRRFYSEAQHAAKLSHPNIVNIYDVGRQDDTYFIVMELVEGATLAEMIETDHRLPEPVAIDYAAQICNGLAYAHRQGLLHRDIKPANILVTKDDVVKLSDFGIARAVSQHTMTVTQPGMVMGSVYYISPEQAQGHDLHEMSDLYSLGVVLYEMLTGKLPYAGDSPITVAIKHVSSPIPTTDLNDATVSPALAAIVRKLLQKEPNARFASATEVASALREAREHPLQAAEYEVAGNGIPDGATRLIERVAIPPPPPRRSKFPDRRPSDETREIAIAAAQEPEYARKPRRRVVPLLLLLLFLSAAAGFAAFGIFGAHTPVRLGNYAGLRVSDAQDALLKAGLVGHLTEVPSENAPRGTVVSQQPTPGATLAPHSVVELFVSSGLPIIEMTDLRSFSQEDAERYLRNAKLTPKFVQRYDSAPSGTVIDQSPLPGTQVAIHSVVTLTVSQGLAPARVPDLVSLTLDDAGNVVKARKLTLNITDREPSDEIPANVILSQDPKAGSDLVPPAAINVVVSTGPVSVTVPDVGGQNVTDATAAMQNAGLVPHLVYLAQSGTTAGTVIDETPAASSTLSKGATVTLTIAVPGVVPSVVGMTLDQAKAALVNAGYTVGNVAYTQDGTPGTAVRTEPDANSLLRPGEAVTIYFNNNSTPVPAPT